MKLFDDLLKYNNKYSRKSIIVIATFVFVLLLGTFIVISDKILEKEVNRYAIEVFNSLLIFLGTSLSLTTLDKKIASPNTKIKEEEI